MKASTSPFVSSRNSGRMVFQNSHPEIEEWMAFGLEGKRELESARGVRQEFLDQFFASGEEKAAEVLPVIPQPTCPITTVIVNWGNDLKNINLAFALQNASESLRRCHASTFLRSRHDEGMQETLAPAHREF